MTDELPDLEAAVDNGTHLEVLQAMAALAAHELSGNRCPKCQTSVMKMGEISSLMLRLQKIFEEIEVLKSTETGRETPDLDPDSRKVVSLRDIRNRNQGTGNTDTTDPSLSGYGNKSSPRKSSSRKSSG